MIYIDNIVRKINYYLLIFLILLIPIFFFNRVFDNFLNIGMHNVLWVVMPVFALIYIYNIVRKKIKIGIFDCLIVILVILNIITCIFALNRDVSIYGNDVRYEGLFTFLSYYSIFLSCRCLDKNKYVTNILNIFLLVGIFQFVYCVFQIYFKDLLSINFMYRFSSNMANGFINNPNFMASLVILFLGFVIVRYLTLEKGYIWYFILSACFFVNILFSQSTGPFLAVICMVIFELIFLIVKKRLKIYRYIILVGVFILAYFLIDYSYSHNKAINENIPFAAYTIKYDLKQLYRAFAGEIKIHDDADNNPEYNISKVDVPYDDNLNSLGSGRIKIWRNALRLVPDYYLYGCGIDSFAIAYQWHDYDVFYDKAHNDYLEILVTRGVFTLITYLLFLLMLVIKGFKSNNMLVWSLLLSIVGYAIQSFTNISVNSVAPYFYMMCGFLVLYVNKEKVK